MLRVAALRLSARLVGYMFDFGIGVNAVSSFEIKRMDPDYFSEE
jgi:restriction system protein